MIKTFNTPKGTELPLADIKGKPYLQVAHRIVWFREEHPDWTIKTIEVDVSVDAARYRTEIWNKDILIASGTKQEDKKGFFDFVEKAETGSIGRALALCGYGTQFAPELEEAGRIVDAPVTPQKQVKPPTTQSMNDLPPDISLKELIDHSTDQCTHKCKPFVKACSHQINDMDLHNIMVKCPSCNDMAKLVHGINSQQKSYVATRCDNKHWYQANSKEFFSAFKAMPKLYSAVQEYMKTADPYAGLTPQQIKEDKSNPLMN